MQEAEEYHHHCVVEQADWLRPRRGDWLARLDEVIVDTPGSGANVRASLGLAEGTPMVLYTGTFEHYQGLDLLFCLNPLVPFDASRDGASSYPPEGQGIPRLDAAGLPTAAILEASQTPEVKN